jgi:single-strand DNA-binding protein
VFHQVLVIQATTSHSEIFDDKRQQSPRSKQVMQKVMLIGYLGRDPEVRYSQQGTAVAQFSVATSERWKDKSGELQEHTEWFAVKTFGRRAEIAGEYLHKGSRVYLEGRKRTESWDDKQTGGKHFRDLVYVDKLEFLDSRANGNGHRDLEDNTADEPAIADQDVPF